MRTFNRRIAAAKHPVVIGFIGNAFFNLCDACLAYASYDFLAATLRSYFFE